jgi:predicted nuclease with RNAse H fold
MRETITNSPTTRDWLAALFELCGETSPTSSVPITLAIDAPLGFSDGFVRLVTRRGAADVSEKSEENQYLFRQTERWLFEQEKTPLSAVKDMIGSQATKAMHVLARFAPTIESCGVWTDGEGLRVIETYPAACKRRMPPEATLRGLRSLGHDDKNDARVCALIAYLFAEHRALLQRPSARVPSSEGWIWVPKPRKKKPA